MKKITAPAGVFGPFEIVETLADRYRVNGAAEIPFNVIGGAGTVSDWGSTPLPTEPPKPLVIPASVTRRQARQALLLAGKLDLVQPAIDSIPDATLRGLAQIEWDDSLEFLRERPLVISIGQAIGLDAAALDALFVAAAGL